MPLLTTPKSLAHFGELYHQLGSTLSSGISLVQGIEMLRDAPPSGHFRQHLNHILEDLRRGATFAEAIGNRGSWVPAFDVALLAAGERSGRLDDCCERLSAYYQERSRLMRSVLNELAYPAFLLLLVLLIFPPNALANLFWHGDVRGFVVPKLITLAILGAAQFAILLLNRSGQHGWLRRGWEEALHAIPVFGRARRSLALARLTLALEALLNAGVDVLKSWELAAQASGSPALERATATALKRIAAGATPGEAIAASGVFPPKFQSVYRSGEASGRIDQSLQYLHKDFTDESSRLFKRLAEWTPRLVFLLVAGLIALYIIDFWTGYFGGMLDRIDAATQGQ